MKRYLIIYKGTVQGVGFRWHISSIANELKLTGFVKNLSNGDVEVEVQGIDINEFIKRSTQVGRFIEVEDYSLKQIPIKEDDYRFEIKY